MVMKARVETEADFVSDPFIRECSHVRMTFCFPARSQKLQGFGQKNLRNEDPSTCALATKDALVEKVGKHTVVQNFRKSIDPLFMDRTKMRSVSYEKF